MQKKLKSALLKCKINQMRVKYDVFSSPIADFLIDDNTFEVGAKNKGQKQIKDVEYGYVVKDDILRAGI